MMDACWGPTISQTGGVLVLSLEALKKLLKLVLASL